MAAKHDLENLLNGELAQPLADAGVPAQAEIKQGNRRLDDASLPWRPFSRRVEYRAILPR